MYTISRLPVHVFLLGCLHSHAAAGASLQTSSRWFLAYTGVLCVYSILGRRSMQGLLMEADVCEGFEAGLLC